jgi:excisionase family DNA binding protein
MVDQLSASPPAAESSAETFAGVGSWHLLSVREVAAVCRLSEKAVRRAIEAGELQAIKLRSRLRVAPQDFEAWIATSRRGSERAMPLPRARAPRRPPAGTFRAMVERSDDRGVEL